MRRSWSANSAFLQSYPVKPRGSFKLLAELVGIRVKLGFAVCAAEANCLAVILRGDTFFDSLATHGAGRIYRACHGNTGDTK